MIASAERLREKAHELALTHQPHYGKSPIRRLRRMAESDVQEIQRYLAELAGCREGCAEPAEEWLRDHAEFIQEQAQLAAESIREAKMDRLPRLGDGRSFRMVALCEAYLDLTDGGLEEDSFRLFLVAYQEIAVLTMAEIWMMPMALRLVLIRRLRDRMASVAERRAVCAETERLLHRLEPAGMDAGRLARALDEAEREVPLSGALIAHLIRHLREWAGDAAVVREWLSCKVENGAEGLDRIVSHEYKRQSAAHQSVGRIIGSLRLLLRWDWRSQFEAFSLTEQALRRDPAGDYPRLDHASQDLIRRSVEKLARRFRVPESVVAEQAASLAEEVRRNTGVGTGRARDGDGGQPLREKSSELLPREAFLFYYLLEPKGIEQLRHRLRRCGDTRAKSGQWLWKRPTLVYFAWTGLFFALAWAGLLAWIGWGAGTAPTAASSGLWPGAPRALGWFAAAVLLVFPALELAHSVTHSLIRICRRASPLLKYDFSDGIPPEAATVVAVPVVLTGPGEAREMADRMELHYLASRSGNLHFALLADLPDAGEERLPEDEAILAEAKERIDRLNERYPDRPFHLYFRQRTWNESEGKWMGWERKRGKLVEFAEYARGAADPGYAIAVGDGGFLRRARYLITVDADTELPLESARRMVGAMHLPYNRPRLNRERTRVAEGYAVMQPRIGIRHDTVLRSRLAYLWSRDTGVDPYAFAVSDPYQDLLGHGIYVGKGILDLDCFAELLSRRIPDNTVLSHDLLEGGFLRTGLLTDIELIDGMPGTFHAHQKRLHRWVRGDWQLLVWLLPKYRDREGEIRRVDLPAIVRWQIIDNLRRSLMAPVLVLALLLGWFALPGSAAKWLSVVLAAVFLPVLRQAVAGNWSGLGLIAGQCLLALLTLPYQAVVMADAVIRTLYRLLVSRRRLLEWVSMAEVERAHSGRRMPPLLGLAGGLLLAALLPLVAMLRSGNGFGHVPGNASGSVFADIFQTGAAWLIALVWASAPAVIRFLDKPVADQPPPFSEADKAELTRLAGDIWAFFERYVTAEDHWLPPDNVQLDPPRGTARRTSPTNIGLYMASVMAARDFGFIGRQEAVGRLNRTMETLERMEKWEGHLYNWYDTETLEPLPPRYVSTVDSGNLTVSLMAVRQGVAEWLERSAEQEKPPAEGRRRFGEQRPEFRVAFSEELAVPGGGGWRQDAERLVERIDAFITGTNFRPLYDHRSRLFALGYFPESGRQDGILYDLLASEARLASFAAIALGQVSVAHWHALGRSLSEIEGRPLLLAWSGTMFEYLMPWLFMRTWRRTIWDSTYRAAVAGQLAHARKHGVPLGVSESGYYAFDNQMNYQYQAFGVPELGFKKGLERDLVVAPYAAIMALPYAGKEGLAALREYERLGARGRYGYYEAVDYTKRRMPPGETRKIVTSYMAHHQGMSLLTLANLLLPRTVVDRFHACKEVRAAELLLQERIPDRPKFVRRQPVPLPVREDGPGSREGADRLIAAEQTAEPVVHLLTGGRYAVMVTAGGGGYSMYGDKAVTRWRDDPATEACGCGFYIRDTRADQIWSPSYLPAMVPGSDVRIRFAPDVAEFVRVDGEIRSELTVSAVPDGQAEIRRLRLANRGQEERVLEVTVFQELSLSDPRADAAHPAFSKLFVRTEYVPELDALAAVRRPREAGGSPLWAACGLYVEGASGEPAEFETDRAAFIGRGRSMADPRGLRERLKGKTGSVTDPAFILRRRVELAPGETVTLIAVTAVAGEKSAALEALSRYASPRGAEQALAMAWHRSRTELRHLNLSPKDAVLAQQLAGRLLYPPDPDEEKRGHILANQWGQSGLWSLGISGDRPILAVTIRDRIHLPFVRNLLAMHEYLRLRHLSFDLVLLYESESGYVQELRDALRREAEHGVERFGVPASGIHVLNPGQLAEEARTLLMAKACLVLRADGPSLQTQLRRAGRAAEQKAEEQAGTTADQKDGERPDTIAGKETGERPGSMTRENPEERPGSLAVKQADQGTEGSAGRNEPESGALPQAADHGADGASGSPSAVPAVSADPSAPAMPANDAADENRLLFFNGYGGFSRDGTEYRMRVTSGRHWPAPWINVIAGPSFGCFVSELGTGYTWWKNSRECKLTPWSNDPVLDPPGEVCYVRDDDSGAWWRPATADPHANRSVDVAHGWGYTRFSGLAEGIGHEMTVSVAPDDPVKLIRLVLKNASGRRRRLSVTYFAEWVLGVRREAGAFLASEWDGETRAMLVRNMYQEAFRDACGFLAVHPQTANGGGPVDWSWTSDRLAFIGRYRDAARPAAMEREKLDRTTGLSADPCGAVRASFTLEAGETVAVHVLLGCESSPERARTLLGRYADPDTLNGAMDAMRNVWRELTGRVRVVTPSPETDLLLSGWLLVQTLGCRMWARTAFYQAGGAYGYRDQLQDSLALLHAAPELTRRQILLHASRQYAEGDVQHWWHEETGRGIRTKFSDDLLWLPYAVCRYVEHTGDRGILEETAPYLHSEPLAADEHERYEEAVPSGIEGTVYEHCCRAIDLALRRKGDNGLPLIGVGDWNDGMNLVGDEGRGVSVWLGFFLYEVLRRFESVARRLGDGERADRYAAERRRLVPVLNGEGWDGAWFRRAMTDEGAWLGSVRSKECRIDAIAQSWAVISGAGDEDKCRMAMESLDRELVDRDLALVRLLTPAFEHTQPSPGYIQGYPPGIRENGAQYTHGVLWTIEAWSRLGRGDKAFELFRMLNPVNHARTESEVRRYCGEPYVMAADVYTGEPHIGRAGWTWYTGAAGWMYQLGLEAILGIRMEEGKLRIRPCIPPEWPGYTVHYRYGNTEWRIEVHNPDGRSTGIRRLTVDGEEAQLGGHEGERGALLMLADDGETHRVVLVM